MNLSIPVYLKENNKLFQKIIDVNYIELLSLPDSIYTQLINNAYNGTSNIPLKNVILRKELNYDALYSFTEKLLTGNEITILNEEADIVENINKMWEKYNFFSSPTLLYNLLTLVASVENVEANGPFRKAVAAYNLLFNNTEKFKSQSDFSDKLVELCNSNKNIEQSLNLTTEKKLQILSEKLVSSNVSPLPAILLEQLSNTLTYKLGNYNILINKTDIFGPVSAKKCCLAIKGSRTIFSIENIAHGRHSDNYTISFKTGRCNNCANNHNVPVAAIEDLYLFLKDIYRDATKITQTANAVCCNITKEHLNILSKSATVCANPSYKHSANGIVWDIRELLYSNIQYSTKPPFILASFSSNLNNYYATSLLTVYKSANFTDLCAMLGLVASMIKTTEAKKEAITAKLVKIYNTLEPIINDFFVKNMLGRKSINTEELAVVQFSQTNYFTYGNVYKFEKFSEVKNENINLLNNPTRTVYGFQKTILDKLVAESLIYSTGPDKKDIEDLILNALLIDMFYMYLDLRRTSANFIKWASPKITLPVDISDYIYNHLLDSKSTNIKTINLIFRI